MWLPHEGAEGAVRAFRTGDMGSVAHSPRVPFYPTYSKFPCWMKGHAIPQYSLNLADVEETLTHIFH